jgi:hypothetical protein
MSAMNFNIKRNRELREMIARGEHINPQHIIEALDDIERLVSLLSSGLAIIKQTQTKLDIYGEVLEQLVNCKDVSYDAIVQSAYAALHPKVPND